MPAARAATSVCMQGSMALRNNETSLPSVSPKPPGSRKSRCMSIMTNAVRAISNSIACGCADRIDISFSTKNAAHETCCAAQSAVPGSGREKSLTSEAETDTYNTHLRTVVAFAHTQRQLLRFNQVVVDELVVLHTGFAVPLAKFLGNSQREFHSHAGRRNTDIAVVTAPVTFGANRHPGRKGHRCAAHRQR